MPAKIVTRLLPILVFTAALLDPTHIYAKQ